MRKLALLLTLILIPTSLFAQSRGEDDWRRRPALRDTPSRDAFEITPFLGYRWGGTIFADQTFLFGQDVDVKSSAAPGISLGIPLGSTGLKLELMANRQDSELETDGGLFDPENEVADIEVTYFQAGVQIPFAQSRNARPYAVVSAGIANLDPQLLGVSAENRFAASAGIGVKLPVSRNLAFRFEGRGYYVSMEEEDDCRICDYYYNDNFYQGEVNAGVVFSF
jgi:opacity protein-like surface antigen